MLMVPDSYARLSDERPHEVLGGAIGQTKTLQLLLGAGAWTIA
jgi:hypothetical protein